MSAHRCCVRYGAFALVASMLPIQEATHRTEGYVAGQETTLVGTRPTPKLHLLDECVGVTARILGRAGDAAGSADRDAQAELVAVVRTAEKLPGANSSETCVTRIVGALARYPACGSAAELVTSTLALDGALPTTALEEGLSSEGPCVTALVAGVASSPSADRGLVAAIEAWTTRQSEPMRRSGGFVVLGTLARRAREGGDAATANRIDLAIAEELGHGPEPVGVRAQQIEAAGNAGCAPCTASLMENLSASSFELRRAAVGAFRFVPSDQSATTMCDALEEDADPNVREQAAWALGWKHKQSDIRVSCLVRAAARDSSPRVRLTAAQSLADMSKDVSMAQSALLHLTRREYTDENVKSLATRVSVTIALPSGVGRGPDDNDSMKLQ